VKTPGWVTSERFWERTSWPEAAFAALATPVVLIWYRDSIVVVVAVTMWTWFRGAVGNALAARAGRRANPDDPL
jgi:hypothetical protein